MVATITTVGVLGLQGDVREHSRVLHSLGAQVLTVRTAAELAQVQGLVLPGGESTVMDKLSRSFGMHDPIRVAIANGLPVLGTCAGLIALADQLEGAIDGQQTFGGLDITVRRNAFGRQSESFEGLVLAPAIATTPLAATFIRGPVIERVGPGVSTLATLPDGTVVGVQQGALTGLSFHPELVGETRFHERFLAHVAHRNALDARRVP